MTFEEVTKENLELAIKIQKEIFPEEDGTQNLKEAIHHDPYRKELIYWIAFVEKEPVGINGLYSYNEYPDDAWLGWFGILKEFRNRGYAFKMLQFFEESAKDMGYSNIRLYTDKIINNNAMNLYYKYGMCSEEYKNKKESKEVTDSTLIFSKNISNGYLELWNDKFLELTDQFLKEKNGNSI